jgi:WD40 repeat protein
VRHHTSPSEDSLLSPLVSSDLLFAGLEDGRICCWRAGARDLPLCFLQDSDQQLSPVNALCAVDETLFSGHESGDLLVWKWTSRDDLPSFHLWDRLEAHSDAIRAFALCLSPSFSLSTSPSFDRRPSALLISASADQSIRVWNAAGCLTISDPPLVLLATQLESMSVNAIAVEWTSEGHGDGRSAQAAGHFDRLKTSPWLRIFSASGSGSWDRIIRVFTSDEDGANIRQTGSLRGHTEPIDSLVIVKPFGREREEEREAHSCHLVSSSSDHTLRVWNTRTNSQVSPSHALSFPSSLLLTSSDLSQLHCLSLAVPIFGLVQCGDRIFGFSLESSDLFVFELGGTDLELVDRVTNPTQSAAITSLSVEKGVLYIGSLAGTVKELYL